MVKFRGISITIVSQFDICKLPEFPLPASPSPSPDPFAARESVLPSQPIASCYVPIYPGSQIWFEYSVEGPHPKNAAYFFKMLNNGKVVTSWDCTAEYGYCGKTAYALEYLGEDEATGTKLVKRQAFKFGAGVENGIAEMKRKAKLEDCVELRVHRIEHRQRIVINGEIAAAGFDQAQAMKTSDRNGLRLVNSGLLEPGHPKRRYHYQLLDPIDEPYAIFRFYYRTYEFLENHHIVTYDSGSSRSSSFSTAWYDADAPQSETQGDEMSALAITTLESAASDKDQSPTKQSVDPPPAAFQVLNPSVEDTTSDVVSARRPDKHIPQSDLESSPRLVTKDSIEDLPSIVPRSPKSYTAVVPQSDRALSEVPASPSKFLKSSPKKLQKKKLTINLGGTEFDLDKKKRRPLSPFTSSGMLRRMISPTPPSAPAALTEFGPSIYDEIEKKWASVDDDEGDIENGIAREREKRCKRTTRADRSGKTLMGFLGRRIGKVE